MVTPQVACLNVLDSRTVLSRDGFVGTYVTERRRRSTSLAAVST